MRHDRHSETEDEIQSPSINDITPQEPTPLDTMYLPDSASQPQHTKALSLLASAAQSPEQACLDDPEVKEAFDQSLRELAEDIIQFHPGLAHLLVSMAGTPCPVIHGQN